jgi:predicted Holliday junction resolvase-like endonuclease
MPTLSLGDWLKVGLAIGLILLAWYIHALNGKIEKQELEIELWKQAYSILGDKLVEQNAAINKLEEQRKTALKKRAQSDKKAAAIVAHQKEAETRLEAIPSVPEASSTCEAEMDVIKQMLQVGSKGYTGVGQ